MRVRVGVRVRIGGLIEGQGVGVRVRVRIGW